MIKEFLEGETYAHPKHDKDIMVLAVGAESEKELTLAVLWVDRESKETTGGGELVVPKVEMSEWELSEL